MNELKNREKEERGKRVNESGNKNINKTALFFETVVKMQHS